MARRLLSRCHAPRLPPGGAFVLAAHRATLLDPAHPGSLGAFRPPSSPPMSWSDRKRAPLWMWIVAFGLLLGSMLGAALMVAQPALLQRPMLVVYALDPEQQITAEHRREAWEVFEVAGKARLDAAHATALLQPPHHPTLVLLELDTTDSGDTRLRLSRREGASFVNVELEGELELRHGRITVLRPRHLRVSGWNMTEATADEDLTPLANAELAEALRRDPEWAARIRSIGHFHQQGGQFYAER